MYGQVYPTSSRNTGYGAANGAGKVGGMVCPLVAVALVTGCHQTAAVILFEAVAVAAIGSVLLFQFETKGKDLKDNL